METKVRYYSLAPSSVKNNKYYLRSDKDLSQEIIKSANSKGQILPVTARCNYILKEKTKNDQTNSNSSNECQNYLIRTYFSPNKITQQSVLQQIKNLQQKNLEQRKANQFCVSKSQINNELIQQSKRAYYQDIFQKNEKIQAQIRNQEKNIKNKTPNNKNKTKERENRFKAFMNKIHNREQQNVYQERFGFDLKGQIKIIKKQLPKDDDFQEQKNFNQIEADLPSPNLNESNLNFITNSKKSIINNVQVYRYQSKQKIPKKLSPKKVKSEVEQFQTQSIQISELQDLQLLETQKLIQFYSQELKKSQQINTMLKVKITQEQQKKQLLNLTKFQKEQ